MKVADKIVGKIIGKKNLKKDKWSKNKPRWTDGSITCDDCGRGHANFYETPDGDILCTHCYRDWLSENGY